MASCCGVLLACFLVKNSYTIDKENGPVAVSPVCCGDLATNWRLTQQAGLELHHYRRARSDGACVLQPVRVV